MRRILKTRHFSRLARKADLTDTALAEAVAEMERGMVDANLGGEVYKKRVAVGGKGKRGGARTIIATNMEDRWFFLYCFLKNEQSNISARDLEDLKALAKILLELNENAISKDVNAGNLEEIS